MKFTHSADFGLALFFAVFAVLTVFVWVPMDTGTGLVEKVRRKYVIGDALAPSIAGTIVFIGAVLLMLRPSDGKSVSLNNLKWIGSLFVLFVISLMLMRYAGAIAAFWTETGYRPLRASAPWNYIGYVVGGTAMVSGLTAMVARRLAWFDIMIAFVVTLLIALFYDLPFDNLLLPPNGDV